MSDILRMFDDMRDAQPNQLQIISEMVKKADVIAKRIEKGEALITQLKLDLKEMIEDTIPTAMDGAELSALQTDTGLSVVVKPFLAVSIPKDGVDQACDWLEKNDHEEIIKTQVIKSFGKGKLEDAKTFAVASGGTVKREVNWQTLNAWAREVTAPTESGPGLTLPDVFQVYSGQKAIITVTK